MNPGERGSSLEGPLVGTKLLLGAQSRGRSGPQPGEQQVFWAPLAAPPQRSVCGLRDLRSNNTVTYFFLLTQASPLSSLFLKLQLLISLHLLNVPQRLPGTAKPMWPNLSCPPPSLPLLPPRSQQRYLRPSHLSSQKHGVLLDATVFSVTSSAKDALNI